MTSSAVEDADKNVLVGRVLQVLSCFKGASPDLGVTEIHLMTGLNKSVVHRIIKTLTSHGYLVQDRSTRRYRVGLELWELGSRFDMLGELSNIVGPHLTKLVDRYGASGYVGYLDRLDMIYVVSIASDAPVRVHFDIGNRIPALASAFGKAVIAHLPPAELESLLASAREEDRAILSSPEFNDELVRIRELGHAVYVSATRPITGSVGIPLFPDSGTHLGVSLAYVQTSDQGSSFVDAVAADLKALAYELRPLITAAVPLAGH